MDIFYTSKLYKETGNIHYSLAGNLPILINKKTKELNSLGYPLEVSLDEYERNVLRFRFRWKLIIETDLSAKNKKDLIVWLKDRFSCTSEEALNFVKGDLIFNSLGDAKQANLLVGEKGRLTKI